MYVREVLLANTRQGVEFSRHEWEHFLIQYKDHWDCYFPAAFPLPPLLKSFITFIHTISHYTALISLAFHILFDRVVFFNASYFVSPLTRPLEHSKTLSLSLKITLYLSLTLKWDSWTSTHPLTGLNIQTKEARKS